MTKPVLSEDGKWMWNGTNWVAATKSEQVVSIEDIDSDLVESASQQSGVDAEKIAEVARYFDLNKDGEVDASEIEQAAQSLYNPVDVSAPSDSEKPVIVEEIDPKPHEMFDEHKITDPEQPQIVIQERHIPVQEPVRIVQQQPTPVQQKTRVITTRNSNAPSIFASYLLWFFLGWAGIHHLYMGRGVGIWILSLITLQGLGIWWFVDLFLIPSSCSKRATQTVVIG
jgi:TM2 domain-containing membrane protein YozV